MASTISLIPSSSNTNKRTYILTIENNQTNETNQTKIQTNPSDYNRLKRFKPAGMFMVQSIEDLAMGSLITFSRTLPLRPHLLFRNQIDDMELYSELFLSFANALKPRFDKEAKALMTQFVGLTRGILKPTEKEYMFYVKEFSSKKVCLLQCSEKFIPFFKKFILSTKSSYEEVPSTLNFNSSVINVDSPQKKRRVESN